MEKKVIIEAPIAQDYLWAAVSAINKYVKIYPVRVLERRATFYDSKKVIQVRVRERKENIHITVKKLRTPIKYSRGIVLT
jgi:hypothetical protein